MGKVEGLMELVFGVSVLGFVIVYSQSVNSSLTGQFGSQFSATSAALILTPIVFLAFICLAALTHVKKKKEKS